MFARAWLPFREPLLARRVLVTMLLERIHMRVETAEEEGLYFAPML